MIGLPEVETTRRDLEREITGKRIKDVEVSVASLVARSGNRTKFAEALEGAKITSVHRTGLLLRVSIDTDAELFIDLGSDGRLARNANKDDKESKTVAVVTFTQTGQLRLIDPKGDAEMFTVPEDEIEERVPELLEVGLDPIDQPISWTVFGELLLSHSLKLRQLLMSNDIIAGINELYADEILFNAGLRHDRMSDALSTQEIRRLYRALVETLHDAVKYRGSSLEDNGFVDIFGKPGTYQEHHSVYRKAGDLSPRSRRPIAKAKVSGRWTYFCEQSQV